jgi:TusE/DsrC/DsvC family sulfur relay protein
MQQHATTHDDTQQPTTTPQPTAAQPVDDAVAELQRDWEVIRYLRDEYQANGHTPNFRNMLKGFQAIRPAADSKYLYDLFPVGPAKQGVKIAGLPQPYGKGGY